MMTGTHSKYNRLKYKHEKWLAMLKQEIIDGGVLQKIEQAKSLEEVYHLLNSCSFLGGFLSYQYAIDLNYSPYINFSENSFVKAGIGAIRGIKKCFMPTKASDEDIIRFVQDNIDEFRRKYGYNEFVPLPCHEPQLIDLQNCFCETDKYLRAKMPELLVGNVRIKQTYHPSPTPIHYYFPDKWNKIFVKSAETLMHCIPVYPPCYPLERGKIYLHLNKLLFLLLHRYCLLVSDIRRNRAGY